MAVQQARVITEADALPTSGPLPFLVTPSMAEAELEPWLEQHRDQVDRWLLEYGGILFRGFEIDTPARFHACMERASRELVTYKERSSPRTLVRAHVYTSTDHPPDQRIFPHNEHSYAWRFPTRIAFCCVTPAASGGETPLVDCRRLLARIPKAVRATFEARGGWMYVRNFGTGLGLSWQTTYQTTDRRVVEAYCDEHDIQWEWRGGDKLRTIQVRPVVSRHPVSHEAVWFNHATFFNVETLPPDLREPLLQHLGLEDLPNNTYYGDGSLIEPGTLAVLQGAYSSEQVMFRWERGDLLLLDNMLVAHGRSAYEGERRVLVSMADPVERRALPALPA